MLELLNKLVFGECSQCKQTTMVRPRLCDETGGMSHTCVKCVLVDGTDMGNQSLVAKHATSLH
jgi:hypothetical protein